MTVEFPVKQKKQQHLTSVFTYKFSQPMVSYGTGVTQGPRMLGGFILCKFCDFYDQKYFIVDFDKKEFQGVCFPINCEFIL